MLNNTNIPIKDLLALAYCLVTEPRSLIMSSSSFCLKNTPLGRTPNLSILVYPGIINLE